jgi:tetraacyldisaccharide 4'-kinase
VIVNALSVAYGAAATWRRRWYAREPARARHLTAPVISVGNLRVGGSGKTPTVECLVRLLVEQGERPAILSRGYAREKASRGVTVVADRERILTGVAQSGDEPLLLARLLPGVPVLVCADRYRAGREAERRFGTTVHVLDDGFQHVQLGRDIDLLLIDEDDLSDRVLPAGRLREPIANAAVADAVIVPGGTVTAAREVGSKLGVDDGFVLRRSMGAPRSLRPGESAPTSALRLFAVAGIARPERFFSQLEQAGYQVVGTRAFKDHHRFDNADLERIAETVRTTGAEAVATTEKDAVRLEPLSLPEVPFLAFPLVAAVEPRDAFADWLRHRLLAARQAKAMVS